MGLRRGVVLRATVLAVVVGFAAAGSISNDALLELGHDTTGRRLLQAKKDCPVSFEGANYTIITSRCKGPLYQPTLCCNALKDFACPYSTYINDVTTNCAATMFSYINLYGKYPPGLFANTCHEGDKGLSCPEDTPQVQPGQKASGAVDAVAAPAAALVAGAAALAVSLLMSC
ncbi:GPI-anchored protein LORELEI [Dichanthelium oligosanthes]|uniref:GPI-anchored protein LORELEI n=1 Tax=Dichanthelium oligosanthes TaxID=888268 RepID=A0A1E5WIX8_9POAL|nr:GPI-anchored protein LORELEI [Dichanthelium oligosanthes]